MLVLPGAVLLYGCFLVAGSGATALWSLVQAGLDLARDARRRSAGSRASARTHLTRAVSATTVALLTAGVPACLGHAQWLAALLGTA